MEGGDIRFLHHKYSHQARGGWLVFCRARMRPRRYGPSEGEEMTKTMLGFLIGASLTILVVRHGLVEGISMQQTADAYFAGQEEATKACTGEMVYE
jgi:hypothetical protein